jgi:glycosyltransferase involved in cell wall biosynthesis
MPAYDAARTLEQTVRELPVVIDMKILLDDGSSDDTVHLAKNLGLIVFAQDRNYGYGRNQQTC